MIDMPGMYPFMDDVTQKICDFSGYGHSPTPLNFGGADAEYVDMQLGQGIYTDNINEQLDFGTEIDFDFTLESFSIEAWIQPSASGLSRPIFGKYLANTDGYLFHLSAADRVEFITYQSGASQTTNSAVVAAADLNLHQYIAVRDGATVRLFKDGAEVVYNAVGVHINPVAPATRNALAFGFVGYSNRLRLGRRAWGSAENYERYINAFRL